MKEKMGLLLFSLISALCLVSFAQEPVKSTTNPDDLKLVAHAVAKSPRVIQIPQQFIAQFQTASQHTSESRRAVEDSPAWKNYVIAQNQEQTTLVAIMGELSIKPMTDGCIPVYLRDGKRTLEDGSPVTSATGKLDHFECPVKEEKKP